jgi:SpoIIAA-like
MIEYREIPEFDMIELTIDGHITAEEYHALYEKIEPFLEKHKNIRVLKEVRSFTGLDIGVFKEKLIGAWLRHFKDIRAAALVCDEHWMEQLTDLIKPMFPYPVRCFKLAQIEEARAWLKSIV